MLPSFVVSRKSATIQRSGRRQRGCAQNEEGSARPADRASEAFLDDIRSRVGASKPRRQVTCLQLTDLIVPGHVTCLQLIDLVVPEQVTCLQLTDLVVPGQVTCLQLTDLVVPGQVTCLQLTDLIVPLHVTCV